MAVSTVTKNYCSNNNNNVNDKQLEELFQHGCFQLKMIDNFCNNNIEMMEDNNDEKERMGDSDVGVVDVAAAAAVTACEL